MRRFQDHLPLNRLEGIYAREGLEMARSTLCSWHEQLADLARPLVEAMWEDGLSASPYLCTDATGVLVQAKGAMSAGTLLGGGGARAPRPLPLLEKAQQPGRRPNCSRDYEGYLVADAHAVYDHLYADGKVVEVGCWSHCRRYFFKALSSDPERSREALAYIRGLFDLERAQASAPRKKRQQAREEKSRPLVEGFFAWCEAELDSVLDDTPIAKAVGYALNQREALSRFLEDGRLPLHNNGSELALRRQAVGRKNWLFVGSDHGAEVNTTFVTLLASCQLHGIEPWATCETSSACCPVEEERRARALAAALARDHRAGARSAAPGSEPHPLHYRRLTSGRGIALQRQASATRFAERIHPVHVSEPAVDADPRPVLRIVRLACHAATAAKPRVRSRFVLAGALEIHDRVTRNAPEPLRLGTELADRADLDVVRKQLVVRRVRAAFDDDLVRVEHEPPGQPVAASAGSDGRQKRGAHP